MPDLAIITATMSEQEKGPQWSLDARERVSLNAVHAMPDLLAYLDAHAAELGAANVVRYKVIVQMMHTYPEMIDRPFEYRPQEGSVELFPGALRECVRRILIHEGTIYVHPESPDPEPDSLAKVRSWDDLFGFLEVQMRKGELFGGLNLAEMRKELVLARVGQPYNNAKVARVILAVVSKMQAERLHDPYET